MCLKTPKYGLWRGTGTFLADFEPVEGEFGQLKAVLSQLNAILTDFEPVEEL